MVKRFISKLVPKDKQSIQILLNIFASFLVRGGALIVSLFTLPAYLRYFNDELVLGVWFTAVSVMTWILTFDLGIGNGLRNHVVAPLVAGDMKTAKRYISSAYGMAGIVAAFVFLVGFIVFPFINWNAVFNISPSIISKKVLLKTVMIIFGGIALQLVLKLISSLLMSLQKAALPSLIGLVTNVIVLLYVSFSPSKDIETNLVTLAWINVIAANLPLLVASFILFSTSLRKCKPDLKDFNTKLALDVLKLGSVFLWLQIMFMLIMNTNEFLITWFSDPGKVVDYQIYNKLFMLIATLFTLALTPIWSAVTKASAEKNYAWIGRLYDKLNILGGLAMLGQFAIIPFLQFIVSVWLGDEQIQINMGYAIVFAMSGSAFVWHSVVASIACGLGKLKLQFIFQTAGALLKLILSFVLMYFTHNWIMIIVANFFALAPYVVAQTIWIKRFLKQQQRIENEALTEA
jgi:O-antigen/teichoic acid export membrane protein